MSARIGVVVFPGSNCEHDAVEALDAVGADARLLWHGDETIGDVDGVVLPGGFAHGDYLRTGAIARFSPVMQAVQRFAAEGGPVLGICNGFQILCEAGLLPGALQKNAGLKFLCMTTALRVENTESPLTAAATRGEVLAIPINHFEGNWTATPDVLEQVRANEQVVLRYVDNPNGSMDDVAGICSEARNVVGLMPHPERACDPLLGSHDGTVLLRSFVAWCSGEVPAASSKQPA